MTNMGLSGFSGELSEAKDVLLWSSQSEAKQCRLRFLLLT